MEIIIIIYLISVITTFFLLRSERRKKTYNTWTNVMSDILYSICPIINITMSFILLIVRLEKYLDRKEPPKWL